MYMKKLFNIFYILFFVTSCSTPSLDTNNNYNSNSKIHSYEDINHLKITWNMINNRAETHYFVYFYMENCLHCNELKDYVIPLALSNFSKIYFVIKDEEIPIGKYVKNTIGENHLDYIFIGGYPSLIEFKNNLVINNVFGKEEIKIILDLN